MNRSIDTTAVIVGLLALVVATIGLWEAFGIVDWATAGVVAPVLLIVVGLVGLLTTRTPKT